MAESVKVKSISSSFLHNIQSEQALLGSILLDNKQIENVLEFLKKEHFSSNLHSKIFEAILSISNVHLGTVKSIITFDFLKASELFLDGFIPKIFLFIILFSVKETNLKFLLFFEDLISC